MNSFEYNDMGIGSLPDAWPVLPHPGLWPCSPRESIRAHLGSFAFGRFVLFPARRLLLERGATVRIGRRAFDILLALVERQGEVISKRELMSRAWPSTIVDEGNLKVNIAALRHILGRNSGPSRYIATVSGRGYRFVTPVESSAVTCAALIPATPPAHNNNLPVFTRRIFGRAETITSILHELKSCRLVSIVGPGGVGKTTVAHAVAHRGAEIFDDGAWLVDLASLMDQSAVPNAIAMAIGLDAHSAEMPAICEYLRDRTMLLVVDNCEQLLDEVVGLSDRILNSAKNVKLLVTSREPLCVKGERVRRLSGLRVPRTPERITAAEAMAFPAVQLFADRAAEGCRSFKLDDANAPIVTQICHRLDGLALAIELVATRVESLGVAKIIDHLDNRFHMFDGYHAGLERHRTLTATIDSSYNLLSESERTILRRLSTFAGAFSLELACAIGNVGDSDRARVVDGVANLVSKSLLTAESRLGETEYRQNNITRAFAFERLIQLGELESTRRCHAEHFLDLAERAAVECDQLTRAEWLSRHGAKIDDIRDALNWAIQDSAGAVLAVRLAAAAIPFRNQRLMAGECRTAIERALDERVSADRSARDDLDAASGYQHGAAAAREPMRGRQSMFIKARNFAEALKQVNSQLECIKILPERGKSACLSRYHPRELHSIVRMSGEFIPGGREGEIARFQYGNSVNA